MGRSITPKYRMEFVDSQGVKVQMCWKGKATEKSLGEWVFAYHESMKSGGCNAHIPQSLGVFPAVNKAKVIRQVDNAVVATWNAPMFMVI